MLLLRFEFRLASAHFVSGDGHSKLSNASRRDEHITLGTKVMASLRFLLTISQKGLYSAGSTSFWPGDSRKSGGFTVELISGKTASAEVSTSSRLLPLNERSVRIISSIGLRWCIAATRNTTAAACRENSSSLPPRMPPVASGRLFILLLAAGGLRNEYEEYSCTSYTSTSSLYPLRTIKHSIFCRLFR